MQQGEQPRDDEGNGGEDDQSSLIDKLREFYETADIPIPDDASLTVPTCYSGLTTPEMATRIARMLRGRDLLFTRGGEIGTIDEATGDWRPMNEARFRTWLTLTAGIIFYSKYDQESGKPIASELIADKARAILHSDELRVKLSQIERINLVRMPVFRKELDERGKEERKGFRKLELLPLGYDPPTKTFTVHGAADYDEGLDGNDGHLFLENLIKYFEFSDERSTAVQIAAQMTVFCQSLFQGRSPMFLYNSNLPGSGKSRLAQLALEAVHVDAGKSGYHYNDPAETRKELDATAQELGNYIWFDDVSLPPAFKLRSSDLNRWLTGKVWEGRVMQTKDKFKVPLYASTFMTGTGIILDDHIARRTLVVDLFAHQRARDRTIPEDATILNDKFFEDEAIRSQILSSLWSLVKWWDENDRPRAAAKPLESFEGWSAIIPSIVQTAAFGDCLAPFESPDSGDTDTAQYRELALALVKEFCAGKTSVEVTMKDIVTVARLNNLFVDLLLPLDQIHDELCNKKTWEWQPVYQKLSACPPGLKVSEMSTDQLSEFTLERDPSPAEQRRQAAGWTDRSIMAAWSKAFQKSAVKGQWYEDDEGKVWQFGDRRTSAGMRYRIFQVEAE